MKQILKSIFFAGVALCLLSCEDQAKEEPQATLYPESNALLTGWQEIYVDLNGREEPVEIESVTLFAGQEENRIDGADLDVRINPESLAFTLNMDQIQSNELDLALILDAPSGKDTLMGHYLVNHSPVVNIQSQPVNDNEVQLDLARSFDPDGDELSFEWGLWDTIITTPSIRIHKDTLEVNPPFLTVSDGITVIDGIVGQDLNGDTVILPFLYTCVDLDIRADDDDTPYLNPDVPLGPMLKKGTKLDIEDGKFTRDYHIGYTFEVSAVIKPHKKKLKEGQLVARTARAKNITEDKVGTTPDGKKGVKAPFPDDEDAKDIVVVKDNYNHHPKRGRLKINTETGVFVMKQKVMTADGKEAVVGGSVQKNRYSERAGLGTKHRLVWVDQPGITVKKGDPIGDGVSYKAYFVAWMDEDRKKCERKFKVEIEVNAKGRVTRNKLTVLD